MEYKPFMRPLLFLVFFTTVISCSYRDLTENFPQPTVWDGDLFLSSQAAIDDFKDTYVGINGDLSIEGVTGDIVDLSPLKNIRFVSGDFIIQNTENIKDLSGLSGLESVGGQFFIYRNRALESFQGLDNLKSVQGMFFISLNAKLQTMQGLQAMEQLGDMLYVFKNASLADLDGLQSIKEVEGNLSFSGNVQLSDFCALQSVLQSTTVNVLTENNAFNPTSNQILQGFCSQ